MRYIALQCSLMHADAVRDELHVPTYYICCMVYVISVASGQKRQARWKERLWRGARLQLDSSLHSRLHRGASLYYLY